jgi:hypothetical protein
MIFFSTTVLHIFDWVASRLALDFDLRKDGVLDSLDEREVIEQLQYGRD